ncbi:MAG: translocation/assembly module TamB [Spirochaetia bacterium]|nr:translocation/assembly module TamB [Spirochaetia bacterium]
MRKFSERLKHLLFLIIAVAAAVVVSAVSYTLVTDLNGRIKTSAMECIESRLHRNVSYERIEPFFLNSITIHDIVVSDDTGRRLVQCGRLRVSFNLLRYIFMHETILSAVDVDNVILSISSQEELDSLIAMAAGADDGKDSEPFGPRNIRHFVFKGNNISGDLISSRGSFRFNKLFANVAAERNSFAVTGKANVSATALNTPVMDFFNAKTSFDSRVWKNGAGFAELSISDFNSDFAKIKKQNYHVEFDSEKISLIKTGDRIPDDYSVYWDRKGGTVCFRTMFENFRLLDTMILNGKFARYNKFLPSSMTGNFTFLHHLGNDGDPFIYSGDIQMSFAQTVLSMIPSCAVHFTGEDSVVSVSGLKADTDRGTAEFSGQIFLDSMLAEGNLELTDAILADGLVLNAKYNIARNGNGLGMTLRSPAFVINSHNLGSSSIVLDRMNNAADFCIYRPEDARDIIADIDLRLSEFASDEEKLSGNIRLHDFDLRHIESVLTGNSRFSNNYYIDSDVYFVYDFERFYMDGRDLIIRDRTAPDDFLRFSVTSATDHISVSDIGFKFRYLEGTGLLNLSDVLRHHVTIESFMKVNGNDYYFDGYYNRNTNLMISGSHDFSLLAEFGAADRVFSLSAFHFPVPTGRNCISRLNIAGSFGRNGSHSVEFNNFSISNLGFLKGRNNFISFNGRLDDYKMTIPMWTLSDIYSEVSGSGEMRFYGMDDCKGWFRGAGNRNEEDYLAYISVDGEQLDMDISVRNSRIERFIHTDVTGNMSVNAEITGSLEMPEIAGQIVVSDGTWRRDPLDVTSSFEITRDRTVLHTLHGRAGKIDILGGSGDIDWNRSEYKLDGDLMFYTPDLPYGSEGQLSLSGTMMETGGWIFNPAVKKNRGNLKLSSEFPILMGYDSWSFDYDNDGDTFRVCGGPFENSIVGQYSSDGKFSVGLHAPLFVEGNMTGTLKDGTVDALMQDIFVDFGAVGQVMGPMIYRPLSGTGHGILRFTGAVDNPDIWGTIYAENVYSHVTCVPDILGPFDSVFYFQGKDITSEPGILPLANSTGYVKVHFVLEHWGLDYLAVNLGVFGDNKKGVRIDDTFYGIDVDGYVSGTMDITWAGKTIWIDGDLLVNDCICNIGKSEETEPVHDYSDYMIDVNLRSGDGVEFFWPTQKLPVLRATAARNQQVHIQFDTNSQMFSFDGQVNFKGGDIFYFSNNFFIKEGYIIFNENQDKFDPIVTINAEMRTLTRDNEKVKLFFLIDDTPLSHFLPRIESVPALSQTELYEILGNALVGGQVADDDRNTMSTLANAGSYGTQLIGLFRPLERTAKDFLHLDLFSIRAQLSDKIFNDRRNEQKSNVDMKQISSNTYFNNIDIFVGKYFGKNFFLDATLRFSKWDFDTFEYYDYDMPNFFNTMYLESEINLEANTPLFILNVGLFPKFGNLTDSLLDTTIGLSWRFTF